ncbi:MAG: DUF3137 domain-containing protein [Alphaproteobacteria bacterium]
MNDTPQDLADEHELDNTSEIETTDDHIFATRLDSFLKESEDFRMQKMQEHQSRDFLSLTIILASVVLGAGGFGWYLLMMGNIGMALLCMMIALLPHLFLHSWVQEPINSYKREYKKRFMPKLAKILGGLNFYPKRGISRKVLSKTVIVPAHETYRAEDCFAGKYKGAKITFSEAVLKDRSQKQPEIFRGIFVLIELQQDVFQGHSVITTDGKLAQRLMKKFKKLPISHPPYDSQFSLLTSDDTNKGLDKQELFKELSEASALFNNAKLSAAFFAKKYIFMMIPTEEDMFEPSDVNIPITNNEAALRCKKEVEQLLSIIDIIGVYESGSKK